MSKPIIFLIKVIFLPALRYFSVMYWLSRIVYFVPLFLSCYGKLSCSCFSFLLDQHKPPENQQLPIASVGSGSPWERRSDNTAVHFSLYMGTGDASPCSVSGQVLRSRTSPMTIRSQLICQYQCCRNMSFGALGQPSRDPALPQQVPWPLCMPPAVSGSWGERGRSKPDDNSCGGVLPQVAVWVLLLSFIWLIIERNALRIRQSSGNLHLSSVLCSATDFLR